MQLVEQMTEIITFDKRFQPVTCRSLLLKPQRGRKKR